jgi:4-amino-4-deoxy-L-arabinose transferase-like glycosyltransferase
MRTRSLLLVVAVALAHAGAYIVHQRPDWGVSWTDQGGYQRLGEVLASTGKFTRYPDASVFVPEVIRTPGYPAYVALVYLMFGAGNQMALVVTQAFVFAALCLIVFAIARRITTERNALAAAWLAALFSPFPYFGALALTELWTAFVASLAMLACIHAIQSGRMLTYALAGVLFSLTTLVRPAFVLLPFFLAFAVPLLVQSQREHRALVGWAALCLAAALTLVPWFTYNYVHLGRFTLSPAGGVGRGLWEASWQGRWPGRVQAALTEAADATPDRAELDRRALALAAESGLDPAPMRVYVHEWRAIHDMWDTPTDPMARADARVAADRAYLEAAVAHMRDDPVGHLIRRLTRGPFVLWAADIPVRYTLINRLPVAVIRGIWLLQVLLLAAAAIGAVRLARSGRRLETIVLVLPLVYVTAVHLPLLCEARQSLPVKPLVIVLAAAGLCHLRNLRLTFRRTEGPRTPASA